MARPSRHQRDTRLAFCIRSMKPKHWRIENGAVVPCSAFDVLRDSVPARTKAEATSALLARAERIAAAGSPRLYVKNGAFLLITHSGSEFVAESGRLDRDQFPRECHPLCTAGHATLDKAKADSAFAYYSGEEYARVRENQVAALAPERIASALASQALSDAAIKS